MCIKMTKPILPLNIKIVIVIKLVTIIKKYRHYFYGIVNSGT